MGKSKAKKKTDATAVKRRHFYLPVQGKSVEAQDRVEALVIANKAIEAKEAGDVQS